MRKLLPVGCIRCSLRMGFKTLSFFCPVLGGPPGEAGSAPLRRADRCGVSCRRRSGSPVSPVGSPLESGVSPAHIGPSNACPRAAPETTPLWRLFLIKLSLSLSLSPRLSLLLLLLRATVTGHGLGGHGHTILVSQVLSKPGQAESPRLGGRPRAREPS